jgi:hypothetical protein
LPALALVIGHWYRHWFDQRHAALVRQSVIAVLPLFIWLLVLAQAGAAYITFRYSLNPVLGVRAEFSQLGIQQSLYHVTLPSPAAEAIRQHWDGVSPPKVRPPRIATYAAGLLPYAYQEAYIYEVLVSYRHFCHYDWRLSADYINILAPAMGEIDEQLPKPAGHYELVASYPLDLEGVAQHYLVFFDPEPSPHLLPARIGEPCVGT